MPPLDLEIVRDALRRCSDMDRLTGRQELAIRVFEQKVVRYEATGIITHHPAWIHS